MSVNKDHRINAHKIFIDNVNDQANAHCLIESSGEIGENDIHFRKCNVQVEPNAAFQCDKIQSTDGTTMIDFDGTNHTIDFNSKTVNNLNLGTITLADKSVATTAIASTNYSGQDLEYELDQLQGNINAKLSLTGNTGSKYLTTSGAGTIQFSKSISDVVDLTTAQTLTNKTMDYNSNTFQNFPAGFSESDDHTFTGTNTFNGDLINTSEIRVEGDMLIDTTEDGRLRWKRSQPFPLTGTVETYLDITDHQNTGVGPFTLILPSIRVGATQDVLVGRETTDTLTNKTLTSPVISTISNTGTLTLPTSTDTLVGRATTDTLTNKTIDFNSNTIQNLPSTGISASDDIDFTGDCSFTSLEVGQSIVTQNGDLHISNSGSFDRTLSVEGNNGSNAAAVVTGCSRGVNITTNNVSASDYALNVASLQTTPSVDSRNILYCRNDGNVGIGTTTPSQKLHVAGGGIFTGSSAIGTTTVNSNYALQLYRDPAANGDVGLNVYLNNTHSSSFVANFANGNGDGMAIRGNGYVGIGTVSPNTTLEVHGGAKSTDEVCILSNSKDSSSAGIHTIFVQGGHHIDVYNSSTIQSGKSTSNGFPLYLNHYSGQAVYVPTSQQVTSDDRLKHNEQNITNGLDIINQLQPQKYFKSFEMYDAGHSYDLDDEGNPITNDNFSVETGLIAQDVQQIPEVAYLVQEIPDKSYTKEEDVLDEEGNIVVDEEGNKQTTEKIVSLPARLSLRYQDLFVYNIAATKELHAMVLDQATQLEAKDKQIADLQSQLTTLQQQVQTLFTLYQQ